MGFAKSTGFDREVIGVLGNSDNQCRIEVMKGTSLDFVIRLFLSISPLHFGCESVLFVLFHINPFVNYSKTTINREYKLQSGFKLYNKDSNQVQKNYVHLASG